MAAAAGARIRAFHDAQNAGHPTIYDRALAELRDGRKRSHWIWFVLPQLAGLGRSAWRSAMALQTWIKPAPSWPTRCCGSGWRR